MINNSHVITPPRSPKSGRRKRYPADIPDIDFDDGVWSLLCEKDEKYKRDPHLFKRQQRINPKMRAMLIDWIMDVCADKHLHRETFHLCVDYVDRYLGLGSNFDFNHQISPGNLQLIGSTALVIASKIEEIYPPKVAEIADFTDGLVLCFYLIQSFFNFCCCEDQDIRDLEEIMLQRLEWNCYPITAVHWLALYMQLMNTCDVLPAQQVIVTAENEARCSNASDCSMLSAGSRVAGLNVSIVTALPEEDENLTDEGDDSENQTPNGSESSSEKKTKSFRKTCARRVFSFNSSFPRMQLSHIGLSPRILLHTAAADISYVSQREYSSGHIYPDQRCSVPKLMRGEFVRVAMILDLVILSHGSLRFRYRELAAAALLCSYEPESLICQITGFTAEKLREARKFVDPFVHLFDRLEPSGNSIPCLPTIQHDDRHNIQTYLPKCLSYLEQVEQEIMAIERRKKLDNRMNETRLRKRKFGSTLNSS
uniref:Cyclin N-terminal domain-containing protein n=1 Tax=Meloidogyne javanica TaxID=6303 RepID=A0A915LE79_MELJA